MRDQRSSHYLYVCAYETPACAINRIEITRTAQPTRATRRLFAQLGSSVPLAKKSGARQRCSHFYRQVVAFCATLVLYGRVTAAALSGRLHHSHRRAVTAGTRTSMRANSVLQCKGSGEKVLEESRGPTCDASVPPWRSGWRAFIHIHVQCAPSGRLPARHCALNGRGVLPLSNIRAQVVPVSTIKNAHSHSTSCNIGDDKGGQENRERGVAVKTQEEENESEYCGAVCCNRRRLTICAERGIKWIARAKWYSLKYLLCKHMLATNGEATLLSLLCDPLSDGRCVVYRWELLAPTTSYNRNIQHSKAQR